MECSVPYTGTNIIHTHSYSPAFAKDLKIENFIISKISRIQLKTTYLSMNPENLNLNEKENSEMT
jgi:hypothetical protein